MEKEPIKIKLQTVLLIISLIVIIGLIVTIVIMNQKNSIDKNNALNNIASVKSVLTETEIKEILNNYLKIAGAAQGSPDSALKVLSEMTGKEIICKGNPIAYQGDSILPTNITYSEFKELILNYMTEEVYNEYFPRFFIEKDGKLYCNDIGATGLEYEIISIEKDGGDTKYNARVYAVYSEEDKEEMTVAFEINNNSGKSVISKISIENAKNNSNEVVSDNNDNKKNNTSTVTKSSSNTNGDTNKKTSTNVNEEDKYKDITKELSGIDVFYVTNVIKINNDYTLEGVLYKEYTFTKNELDSIVSKGKILLDGKNFTIKSIKDKDMPNAVYVLSDGYTYIEREEDSNKYYLFRTSQISYVWKKSSEFRKITISGDTIIEDEYTEDKTTVDTEFDGWKSPDEIENNTMPSPAYRFEFKNGKCSKIFRATTSI